MKRKNELIFPLFVLTHTPRSRLWSGEKEMTNKLRRVLASGLTFEIKPSISDLKGTQKNLENVETGSRL